MAPGNRESGKILSCVILSLSFLSGSILGAAAAGRMTESGAFDLYDAILRYTLAAKSGTLSTSFTAAFARCFGAIAFAAAMGLTSYCILIVPLVFAFKGFSFSYTICAFCAILGKRNGLLVSLAVCGLRNIFVIFGLVVLSADIYAKTWKNSGAERGSGSITPIRNTCSGRCSRLLRRGPRCSAIWRWFRRLCPRYRDLYRERTGRIKERAGHAVKAKYLLCCHR